MPWNEKIFDSSDDNLSVWQDYYNRLERKSIYHAPGYLKVLAEHFGDQCELFVYGNDNAFVYYPYFKKPLSDLPFLPGRKTTFKRFYDISSSWYYGGPLKSSDTLSGAHFAAFLNCFQEYATQNGIVSEFIRLDPNLNNHEIYPTAGLGFNRETVYVDLKQDMERICQAFSSANRRAIRKAIGSGLEVRAVDNSDQTNWRIFHSIYDSEMRRKNAPGHLFFPVSFFNQLRNFLPDNVVLLVAEKGATICGGFIIVYEGDFAFHFLSASLPEYWKDRVNNLLFYKAIKWARKMDCSIFDFMGGRPGVFKFKSNFSNLRNRFYTYQYIHNTEIYNEMVGLFHKTIGHADQSGGSFFPEYRRDKKT